MFQRGVSTTRVDQQNIQNVHGVWSVRTKPTQADGHGDEYEKYVIASVMNETGDEKSAVYSLDPDNGDIVELSETDFEADTGATVEVGSLNGGTKMVQVLHSELRSYDQGESFLVFCYFDFSIISEPKGDNRSLKSHATALYGNNRVEGSFYVQTMAIRQHRTLCIVADFVLHMSDSINIRHISTTISPLYPSCLQCHIRIYL